MLIISIDKNQYVTSCSTEGDQSHIKNRSRVKQATASFSENSHSAITYQLKPRVCWDEQYQKDLTHSFQTDWCPPAATRPIDVCEFGFIGLTHSINFS